MIPQRSHSSPPDPLVEHDLPLEMPRKHRSLVVPAAAAGLTAMVLVISFATWLVGRPPVIPSGAPAKAAAFTVEPLEDPTPILASYRSLLIHLPVPDRSVTQLAFHQASYASALHLDALVADADVRRAARSGRLERHPRAVEGDAAERATAEGGDHRIWDGTVLRLWRSNRRGVPDTAMDVGARPGTTVFAPVTGEVVSVRSYLLYGKYQDHEIHIRPEAWPDVECVLIHVSSETKAGARVEGGVTPIGRVRKLSDREELQLGQYTKDGGDHVHVQMNAVTGAGAAVLDGGS